MPAASMSCASKSCDLRGMQLRLRPFFYSNKGLVKIRYDMVYYLLIAYCTGGGFPPGRLSMGKKQRDLEERLPVLEIKPSEEYHERPLWQRVAAFIMIGLIVAGTVSCVFWQLK